MTGPEALFDVDALRDVDEAHFYELAVTSPTVVLGSRQDAAALDMSAVARDGVAVRRRRGGGGAVLLRPGDCWVELWLPAGVGPTGPDVRATACRVGEWWHEALGVAGVGVTVHRTAVVRATQGAVACFAGIGPGEVTVGGRKLLGLSQWRAREGVLVSCVIAVSTPGDLAAYLARPDLAPALADALALGDTPSSLDARALADGAFGVATRSLGDLVHTTHPPS